MTRIRALLAAAAAAAIAVTLAASPVGAADGDLPAFDAPLVDSAGAVPNDVERTLSAELQGFQDRTGMQIGVAVVGSTGDRSLEDYANDLFDAWGLGSAAQDDGVLVLVALGGDRGVRIEVGGGLEDDLTDVEAARIVDTMVPSLRAGAVDRALRDGISLVRSSLGDPGGPAAVADPSGRNEPSPWGSVVPLLVVVFVLLAAMRGRRRRGRRGRGFGPFIFWGGGLGGGSFGGGGFGGGGFGGGAGGDSFGGGASGRW